MGPFSASGLPALPAPLPLPSGRSGALSARRCPPLPTPPAAGGRLPGRCAWRSYGPRREVPPCATPPSQAAAALGRCAGRTLGKTGQRGSSAARRRRDTRRAGAVAPMGEIRAAVSPGSDAEPSTAFRPARADHRRPRAGAHANPKAMGALSPNDRWLVGALHGQTSSLGGKARYYKPRAAPCQPRHARRGARGPLARCG